MLERMAQAAHGEDDPLDADIGFHAAILDASNNPFFYTMGPMIETALHFSIRFTNKRLKQQFASVDEHSRIFEAIRLRDADLAEVETRALLQRALNLMESYRE
jgi:DNA-binding FadR family transcriptional regulator